MNTSGVPTRQKVMLPLRLPPEVYDQMIEIIYQKKKEDRGYSINQYLSELIAMDLKDKGRRR